jgi:tetratricopeptide (TPR) repeat protein
MSMLFAERGNQKRALELIDDALSIRDDAAALFATRAQVLKSLGRDGDALDCVTRGLVLDPKDRELLALRQQLGG